jgi:hypothetical protein
MSDRPPQSPAVRRARWKAGLGLGALAVSAAFALSTASGSAAPRTIHTRTAVIGAAAFGPIANDCVYGRAGLAGGDDPGLLRDGSRCSYAAAVTLPQNAHITRLRMAYDSHTPGTGGVLQLTRHLVSGGSNDIAEVTALPGCAAPCSVVSTDVAHGIVDNATFTYALRLYNGPPATAAGFFLMKAVITYTTGH